MSLPRANSSFTIPSLHDGLELDCRLYYPVWSKQKHDAPIEGTKFAVLAHPYAPLGGSYDDPIIGIVGSVLIRQGFILLTFNYRGAGESAGRTSWSAKAELADFVSMVGFMLSLISDTSSVVKEGATQPLLLLGGYSYGSMLCTYLPSIQSIIPIFTSPPKTSIEFEICSRAREVSRDLNAFVEMHRDTQFLSPKAAERPPSPHSPTLGAGSVMGGYESHSSRRRSISTGSPHHTIDVTKVRHSLSKVRGRLSSKGSDHLKSDLFGILQIDGAALKIPKSARILVSPLLHLTAGFVTMFSDIKFSWNSPSPSSDDPSRTTLIDLPKSTEVIPTCAIYGTVDTFTAVKRLRKWVEQQTKQNKDFVAYEVNGAGHFWTENGVEQKLRESIQEWLPMLDEKVNMVAAVDPQTSSDRQSVN